MKLKKQSSAKEILEYYKARTWPIIDSYLKTPNFPKQFKIQKNFQSEVDYFWNIARNYPERKGKYIRPTVLTLTSLALGGKIENAIQTAAAMQLSEEWILTHDDWEDESTHRRGKPSLHTMYPAKLAINAGDGLHAIMWKIAIDNYSNKNVDTKKILDEFHLILARSIIGQHVEISYVESNKIDYSDDDWFFIADSKTGYYTSAGPIRLGAICAGASEDQLKKLTSFGINLGRCFQLTDDLLDVTTNFSGLKQFGNDIYESKRTLILGHLLRNTKTKDHKRLVSIIGKNRNKKTKKEVFWVINKMKEYNSIEYAQSLAKDYKNKAESILKKELVFLNIEPHRTHLQTLMNFILNRNY